MLVKRHNRGDSHPSKPGLFYWGILTSRKGIRSESWVTATILEQRREQLDRGVRSWQRKNPSKVLANSANQRARVKRLGLKRNRASEQRPHNKAKAAAYKGAWWKRKMASDPLFRLKVLVRKRIRNALAVRGVKKCRKSFEIVGCSPQFLKFHIESLFKPGMSWAVRREIHIDHRIPLASAKTKKEMLALCHYTNLQPLWVKENLSKNAKMPEQLSA